MLYDTSPVDGRFLITKPATTGSGGAIDTQVVLNWFEELRGAGPAPGPPSTAFHHYDGIRPAMHSSSTPTRMPRWDSGRAASTDCAVHERGWRDSRVPIRPHNPSSATTAQPRVGWAVSRPNVAFRRDSSTD